VRAGAQRHATSVHKIDLIIGLASQPAAAGRG